MRAWEVGTSVYGSLLFVYQESCWPMTTTDGWDTVPDPLWKETESTRITGTRHPWGLSPGSVPCQRWDLERAA